jgi:hypothetical protein
LNPLVQEKYPKVLNFGSHGGSAITSLLEIAALINCSCFPRGSGLRASEKEQRMRSVHEVTKIGQSP